MYVLDNVKKTYKSKKSSDTVALNGVSLKLPNKGLVFIVGESGSGKSTLLNVLGCLDSIDEGSILFNGKDISKFSEKEMDSYRNTCVGFVFQDYNVLEQYNVRDNILLSLKLQQKSDIDNSVDKMLNSLGLNGLGDRKINELSGGQKQRVAIARALIKNPNVILADEPTGNLDSESSTQIFELLKTLSKDRLIVVVSHNVEAASLYGDRVIKVKDGVVDEYGEFDVEDLENECIDYKESKLSFKDALKFCFSNISRKKGRFILTAILVAFAVLFMVVTFNIFMFDETSYKVKTLTENNVDSVLVKYEICEPDMYGPICNSSRFDESEFIRLKEEIEIPKGVIYSLTSNGQVVDFEFGRLEYENSFYGERNRRFVEIEDNEVLGELIGRAPSNYNEVVISEVIADRMIFSGVKMNDGEFFKPTSFDDILNTDKLYVLGNSNVKIVGISLVNDDVFKDVKVTNMASSDLEQFYRGDEERNTDYIYTKGFVDNVKLELSDEVFIDGINIINSRFVVREKEFLNSEIIYYDFDGEKVTSSLNYDEVLISINSLKDDIEFEKEFNDFMKENSLLTYNEAIIQFTKNKIIGNDYYKDSVTGSFSDYFYLDGSEVDTFKIVGFVPGDVSYFSSDLKSMVKDVNKTIYGFKLFVDNKSDLKNLLDTYPEVDTAKSPCERVVIEYQNRNEIYSLVYLYEVIHDYVAFITVVFIIFMVLLMYNFIVTTIQVGKREIGVLRALGTRCNDISKIFVSESLILSIIGLVLGFILFFSLLSLINSSNFMSKFIVMDAMVLNVYAVILSVCFVLIMAVLLSLISIDRVTKIKPIDAILDK